MNNILYKQYNGFFKWKQFVEDCEEINTDLTLLRSSSAAERVSVHSNWFRLTDHKFMMPVRRNLN